MAGRARAKSPKASGPLTKHQMARVEHRAQIFRRATEAAEHEPPYEGVYTERLGLVLAAMVADGATLDNISTLPNMPPVYHMTKWIAQADHPFHKLYYDAKQVLIPLYEERAQTAAYQSLKATRRRRYQQVDKYGAIHDLVEEIETDNVARSALRFQAMQWTLSHLSPRKHGRNAEPGADEPNEQLKALFEALKTEG